jgi:hypothetical protein
MSTAEALAASFLGLFREGKPPAWVCESVGTQCNHQRTTRSVSPTVLPELRPARRIKSLLAPHPQVCYTCWI